MTLMFGFINSGGTIAFDALRKHLKSVHFTSLKKKSQTLNTGDLYRIVTGCFLRKKASRLHGLCPTHPYGEVYMKTCGLWVNITFPMRPITNIQWWAFLNIRQRNIAIG